MTPLLSNVLSLQNILWLPLVLAAVYYILRIGARSSGLPPGPPTVPILGNLTVFPRKALHIKFTEWGEFSLPVLKQAAKRSILKRGHMEMRSR